MARVKLEWDRTIPLQEEPPLPNLYEQIGEKIRELRLTYHKGALSQEALAIELGVASNTVSRWETGTYKPTPEDLDKLARFFSVPITVFFRELQGEDARVAALASALGGLNKKDFDEVVRYAEFRKARRALEAGKRKRIKR
jgi:transcriptional regulator with XRE-family HTH domain